MGLVKEPLDVDFVVNPKPLSEAEENAISEFIKADKANRKRLQDRKVALSSSRDKNVRTR